MLKTDNPPNTLILRERDEHIPDQLISLVCRGIGLRYLNYCRLFLIQVSIYNIIDAKGSQS